MFSLKQKSFILNFIASESNVYEILLCNYSMGKRI